MIAALLDAVSLLRGEVAAVARSNARIEETQRDISRRLDVIEAGRRPLETSPSIMNRANRRLSDNLSRKPPCLRVEVAMFASAYN